MYTYTHTHTHQQIQSNCKGTYITHKAHVRYTTSEMPGFGFPT